MFLLGDPVKNAESLIGDAVAAERGNVYRTMQTTAVHISDFLSQHGQELDDMGRGDLVDELGRQVDALVAGEVREYASQEYRSPTAAGMAEFSSQVGKSFSGFGDFFRKYGPWVAAGTVVLAVVYVWRGMK